MAAQDFARRVTGVASLAEPVRRALYEYVAGRGVPVSRDEAASATGVPRHACRFHLDRLVEDGLLEAEYRRLSGRTGPGAGRPAKLYRRVPDEVAVSLPERHYDLAGSLLAKAVERSAYDGTPVVEALHAAAAERGARAAEATGQTERAAGPSAGLGADSRAEQGASRAEAGALGAVCTSLAGLGYEPRLVAGEVVLANCPFHRLAREHTQLVCGMNLALVGAVADAAGDLTARLDPADGRCCVVVAPRGG